MRRPSRRPWVALLALLGAALLIGGLLAEPLAIGVDILIHRNDRALALPPHPAPISRAEADLQDLQDLRRLPDFDRSFSPQAKTAFLAGVDALTARAGTFSDADFEMDVSRLVALAGNGHTTVSLTERASRFGRAPVRLAWFAEGLYIVRAAGSAIDLLGAHVVAIDGRTAEQALAAVAPYISGTAERARADGAPLLESPALLQVVWPDTDGRHLVLTIDGPDGAIERSLAESPPMRDPLASQPIYAITLARLDPGWRGAIGPAQQIPMSLRAPERVAYAERLAPDSLYIRINANANDRFGRLSDQLATIAAAKPPGRPAAGWRWIALDLRFNDGGDELKTMAFTRALPDMLAPDGAVWVLTGNATFSAAIITAARVRHFLGARAHIVGETAGDRDRFWTDGGPRLILPNSGIEIAHAEFLHDWVHGCRSVALCYPYQWIYGVASGDLSPDPVIAWRFSDYIQGRDTVIDRVRALAGAQ